MKRLYVKIWDLCLFNQTTSTAFKTSILPIQSKWLSYLNTIYIDLTMGNKNSFCDQNWSIVVQQSSHKVRRNIKSGSLVEQRQVMAPNQIELEYQLLTYKLRKNVFFNQDSRVVEIYNFQLDKSFNICSSGSKINVYSQYIQRSLDSIDQINQGKALFLMQEALLGFKNVSKFLGNDFGVDASMIGINSKGNVKVWINSDWGKNSPKINIKPQEANQFSLVKSVIKIVQSKGSFSRQYFNHMDKLNQPLSFDQALQSLYDYGELHHPEILQAQSKYDSKTGDGMVLPNGYIKVRMSGLRQIPVESDKSDSFMQRQHRVLKRILV